MRNLVLFFCALLFPSLSTGQTPLSQLKLESVEFSEADLGSVLEFLGHKAKELKGRPSNFVLYDPLGNLAKANPKITLSLRNVPFSTVFKYVTQLSQTQFLVDHRVVWIGKASDLNALRARRSSRTSAILNSRTFARLSQIKVPEIDFSNTPLSDAVEGLRQLDRAKNGPGNLVLIPGQTIDPADVHINMKVAGISMAELVQFSSELSGFRLRLDQNAIVFQAPDARRNPAPGPSPLLNYLNTRVVEQISLVQTSIPEMIEFIRFHSKSKTVPGGINVIQITSSPKTVTLDLKNARLSDLIRYMNEQTDTAMIANHNSIQIIDLPPPRR